MEKMGFFDRYEIVDSYSMNFDRIMKEKENSEEPLTDFLLFI